jgi:hypothetical protein
VAVVTLKNLTGGLELATSALGAANGEASFEDARGNFLDGVGD